MVPRHVPYPNAPFGYNSDRFSEPYSWCKMAINISGDWWVGSEPDDVPGYLRELTAEEGGYLASEFRSVVCPCGSNRFRLERAADVSRRSCASCGRTDFICRDADAWEEAETDNGAEAYRCVGCSGTEVNVCVGFALYSDPRIDGVKWFYVGVRCADCGILGCFND